MTVAKAYKDLAEAGFVEGRARGRHARACAERSRFQARVVGVARLCSVAKDLMRPRSAPSAIFT